MFANARALLLDSTRSNLSEHDVNQDHAAHARDTLMCSHDHPNQSPISKLVFPSLLHREEGPRIDSRNEGRLPTSTGPSTAANEQTASFRSLQSPKAGGVFAMTFPRVSISLVLLKTTLPFSTTSEGTVT